MFLSFERKFVLILVLCVSQCFCAALVDPKATSTEKTEPKVGEKIENDQKSAASPEDMDKSRTHSIQLDGIVDQIKSRLLHSNILTPSIAVQSLPAPAPLVSHPPPFVFGSSQASSYPFPSYGSASYGIPSYGASYGVSQPIHAPVAAPAPIAVSQTTVSKPSVSFNQQVVQQPLYAVSQQVIHKPIYTEILEVVRRPVITEVQELIHKPVLTELQQTIKRPLYTEHIHKKPSYGSVQQEVYQAPLHLQSESIHVVDKPISQVLQLPTQVIQPVATHVVQTPVYHQQVATSTSYHTPAVASVAAVHAPVVPAVSSVSVPAISPIKPISSGISYSSIPSYSYGYGYPSYGYGSASYGYGSPSYGYVSPSYGYGSYGSSYGSGGSSYGYLPSYGYGYSGISSQGGQGVYSYLSESSCRATGTCPKDAEANEPKEMMYTSNVNLDAVTQNVPVMHANLPLNQGFPYMPTMYNSQFPFDSTNTSPFLQKSYISEPVYSDQPLNQQQQQQQQQQPQPQQPSSPGAKASEQTETPSSHDKWLKEVTAKIVQDADLMAKIHKLVEDTKSTTDTDTKKDEINVERSLNFVSAFAKKNPSQWNKIYSSEIEPQLRNTDAIVKKDEGKKVTEEKKV